MIGFNHLGRLGRLANQMFQYASLRGIAAHRGFEFCIPPIVFGGAAGGHRLFEGFKLEGLEHIRFVRGPTVRAKHFHFDQDLFEKVPDETNISGHLQTEKYFSHVEAEIRKDFQFKDEIFVRSQQWISRLDLPVALHVRRGDYVGDVNFSLSSRQYYNEALSHFEKDRTVVVFSDDPEWCKQEFLDDRFVFSEGYDDLTDLCMMSLCAAHIIANSSFSWWGAWLANSDLVFTPKAWFGREGHMASLDTSDLIPERWHRI